MLSLDPITLRERVEELEEEVRQLRAALMPPVRLPPHWGITAAQERCLRALAAQVAVIAGERA